MSVGFFIVNQPFWGSQFMETPISWISHSLANQALQLVVAGLKLCGVVGQGGALGNQITGLRTICVWWTLAWGLKELLFVLRLIKSCHGKLNRISIAWTYFTDVSRLGTQCLLVWHMVQLQGDSSARRQIDQKLRQKPFRSSERLFWHLLLPQISNGYWTICLPRNLFNTIQ